MTPADGRAHQRSQTRGRSSESHFSHTRKSLYFLLFLIPYSKFHPRFSPRATSRHLLTHDAFSSSLPYQIPPLPSPPSPIQKLSLSPIASIPPRPILRPYGSTRFDSSLLRPCARIYAPSMPIGMRTPSRLAAHFQSRIHATILISHAHLPLPPCFPITLDPIYHILLFLQALFRDSN